MSMQTRMAKPAEGMPTKDGQRISVTLPDYLFEWIREEAAKSNVSIAGQIVEMLESYVPSRKENK